MTGASLYVWGSVLRAIIKRVRKRGERALCVGEPRTISALAAGASEANRDRLNGALHLSTICATGGGAGVGTDIRDVWITTFLLPDENLWMLFMSPSGLVLGSVVVPPEWTSQRRNSNARDIASEFERLNPPSSPLEEEDG